MLWSVKNADYVCTIMCGMSTRRLITTPRFQRSPTKEKMKNPTIFQLKKLRTKKKRIEKNPSQVAQLWNRYVAKTEERVERGDGVEAIPPPV